MKKHVSVLMLFAGSTFWKVLGILALLAVADWGVLYYFSTQQAMLDQIFNYGFWVFLVVSALMTWVLARVGCAYGSQTGYTVWRLRISEKSYFLWQSLYNTICYFVLWAVQAAVLYGFAMWYTTTADPSLIGEQTIFLGFYRSEFAHAVLPMEDVWMWVRNVTVFIGMGVTSAHFSYQQRFGRHGNEVMVMLVLLEMCFRRNLEDGNMDIFAIIMAVCLIALALYRGLKWRSDDENTY